MADEGPRKAKKKSSSGSKPVDKDASAKKKQLEASIRTQVAAEEKAHHIVEQLVLENSITENYLLEMGNYITTSHYSDIIEERAIAKVCGYPLCSNALTQVPKQKYKISVKTNRVFDITERKNYCSNFCYKASKYFESQISTSPVWTRIGESPKKFTLLKATDSSFKDENESSIENTSTVGSLKTSSDENILHDAIRNSETDYKEGDDTNHSTVSSKETTHNEADITIKLSKLAISATCKPLKDSDRTKGEYKVIEDTDSCNKLGFPCHRKKSEELSSKENQNESLQKIHVEKKILRTEESERNAKEIFLNSIKDTLVQWFTDSTYRYLHMVSTSSWKVETLENNSGTQQDVLGQNKQQNNKDRTLRFHKTEKEPSYAVNNHEAGDSVDDNQTGKNSRLDPENMKITEKNTSAEEGFPCVVPPVDSKSQLTIRRQIVLEKLTQVLPEVLVMTPHNKSELITHFTALVRTFGLDSRNTMFKPLQWKVLAITLVLLLERHHGLKGGDFPSDSSEKMVVNLGLTIEDMNNIMDSISVNRQETVSFQDTETAQEHSGMYSRMEDLD